MKVAWRMRKFRAMCFSHLEPRGFNHGQHRARDRESFPALRLLRGKRSALSRLFPISTDRNPSAPVGASSARRHSGDVVSLPVTHSVGAPINPLAIK